MKCGHVLLRDTSGSFTLAIRLPTKDYQPRQSYKQRHRVYLKKWRIKNKQHLKHYGLAYYKSHKKQFQQYYSNNKKRILLQQKQYRNRKKNGT
jgi:hypothetical protein